MATFPEKLRAALETTRRSQQDLADEMSCSQSLVHKWLTDSADPDYRQVKRLADILGCSVDYLCDDSRDVAGAQELRRSRLVQEAMSLLTSDEVFRRIVRTKP